MAENEGVKAFPFADAGSPEHGGPLPEAADVVVIGGGIAGVSTAWALATRGLRVVLCEKGRVGAEQSGRNWGWIRVQGRDPDEIPLVLEARRLWADWAERLGAGLGHRVRGTTYLARHEPDMAGFEAWLPHARAHDLDTRLASRAEVAALFPDMAPGSWCGAMITPSDARAEPFVAVPLVARAAVEAGVVIREHCAVRAVDLQAGRVAGVVTEHGRLRAEAVVLTGGAWSSLLLRAHGVTIPQLSVLASVAATGPMPAFFDGGAVDDRFAFRRRADGGYTLAPAESHRVYVGPDAFRHAGAFWTILRAEWRQSRFRPAAPRGFPDGWTTPRRWTPDEPGPFEAMRVLNPTPDVRALRRMRRHFARAFPALGEPGLRLAWGGMIDTMPDVVPILDRVPSLPGLVLGTGLSGHGFGIGPAVGRVLAALATGDDPGHDLRRFRFDRFADGSRVTPGPSL